MNKVYIWRDKHDPNQFWIGIKNSVGKTYAGWIPIFCDAFSECFGMEAWNEVKDLVPGDDPIRVELALRIA